MDVLDVILAVEQRSDQHSKEELLSGISEHKDTLRALQGSWGRLIANLEEQGLI